MGGQIAIEALTEQSSEFWRVWIFSASTQKPKDSNRSFNRASKALQVKMNKLWRLKEVRNPIPDRFRLFARPSRPLEAHLLRY
jgi:hypothetical protein